METFWRNRAVRIHLAVIASFVIPWGVWVLVVDFGCRAVRDNTVFPLLLVLVLAVLMTLSGILTLPTPRRTRLAVATFFVPVMALAMYLYAVCKIIRALGFKELVHGCLDPPPFERFINYIFGICEALGW
jgi:hypothetical protein